jgi:hypothetical protein
MTYATVMVGLSIDQPNEARLEIGGQLAERFGAKVIGITAAEFSPPLYFTSGEQAQKLVDQGRTAIKNRVAEVESEFRAAMQTASLSWNGAALRIFQRGTSFSKRGLRTLSSLAKPAAALLPIRLCR